MNLFKKVFYNITRPYAKRYFTGNLGEVVEDDEKITCYVKRSKIKKKDYHYTIVCSGIGEEQNKLAKIYKLNKPICYVIDDIKLMHKVYIFGYDNCEVIIKNCNFGLDLCIRINGKCILDNTNITKFSYLSISANDLVIKNMGSDQINAISCESNIYFGADNRIEVIDSNIGSQKKNINVSFNATNELNIVNSNIVGKEVECKSNLIYVDEKSSLNATDKVELQTNDFNPINISSTSIILNDVEIPKNKDSVILKHLTEPLEIKRLELIEYLRNAKTKCEYINSKKLLEYQEKLNEKPISKVLKNN